MAERCRLHSRHCWFCACNLAARTFWPVTMFVYMRHNIRNAFCPLADQFTSSAQRNVLSYLDCEGWPRSQSTVYTKDLTSIYAMIGCWNDCRVVDWCRSVSSQIAAVSAVRFANSPLFLLEVEVDGWRRSWVDFGVDSYLGTYMTLTELSVFDGCHQYINNILKRLVKGILLVVFFISYNVRFGCIHNGHSPTLVGLHLYKCS